MTICVMLHVRVLSFLHVTFHNIITYTANKYKHSMCTMLSLLVLRSTRQSDQMVTGCLKSRFGAKNEKRKQIISLSLPNMSLNFVFYKPKSKCILILYFSKDDGGPRSQVCAHSTLRSAPHRHQRKFFGVGGCKVKKKFELQKLLTPKKV